MTVTGQRPSRAEAPTDRSALLVPAVVVVSGPAALLPYLAAASPPSRSPSSASLPCSRSPSMAAWRSARASRPRPLAGLLRPLPAPPPPWSSLSLAMAPHHDQFGARFRAKSKKKSAGTNLCGWCGGWRRPTRPLPTGSFSVGRAPPVVSRCQGRRR